MGSPNPKILIVEGPEDLYSVVHLMKAQIPWPLDKSDAPVQIKAAGGAETILDKAYLTTWLKARDVRTVGVLMDADVKPQGRYDSIRNRCVELFPALPLEMPRSGLIAGNGDRRFGVWIMPDNASEGSIETFLRYLVPPGSEGLWNHAVESVRTAKQSGAGCRESHVAKANLYTWLAWQDPPGQSPGNALTRCALDPLCASAAPFVQWFRELFQL